MKDISWLVFKELRVGLVIGLVMALIGVGQAVFLQVENRIALVVALTLISICVWSATVASALPLVLRRLGVDPAVVSAPLISTLVDGTGLIIYFEIAKLVLRL
jgi:magnesium transporter